MLPVRGGGKIKYAIKCLLLRSFVRVLQPPAASQQGKKTNGTDDLATLAAEARTKNERSSHNKRINECFYFEGKKSTHLQQTAAGLRKKMNCQSKFKMGDGCSFSAGCCLRVRRRILVHYSLFISSLVEYMLQA
jgi:hypothetical protein